MDIKPNQPAEICAVGNQSNELLELLGHRNITIGTKLEVKQQFPFDRSLEIKIKNIPAFTISRQLAENLFVKTIA